MQCQSFARLSSLLRLPVAVARHRGASAAVETAFVLPVLLLFIFGIIETGRVMWQRTAINMAVEDAARYASVSLPGCGTTTQVEAYAETRTWGLKFPLADFQLSTPGCGCQVNATVAYTPFVNIIPYSTNLTASACFPIWRPVPPAA